MASCHWNYCFKWKTTAHRRREKKSANWFLRVKLCFFLCHFDAFTFILAETLALILVELLVAPLLYCILSYNIKLDADMAVDQCSVQVPWTLLEALDGAGLRKKWLWILTKQILIHSNAKKQTTQHRLASHDVTEPVFSWQYSQIYIRHWHHNQQLTEELLSVRLWLDAAMIRVSFHCLQSLETVYHCSLKSSASVKAIAHHYSSDAHSSLLAGRHANCHIFIYNATLG